MNTNETKNNVEVKEKTCPMCGGYRVIKIPADFNTCVTTKCKQCGGIGKIKV